VLKLRSHPWIPSSVVIRGFVFDLATGRLSEVTPKDESVLEPLHKKAS
jgi:carbonic anhydrase